MQSQYLDMSRGERSRAEQSRAWSQGLRPWAEYDRIYSLREREREREIFNNKVIRLK